MSEAARDLPAESARPTSRLWSWLEGRTGIGSVVEFLSRQSRKPVPRDLSWLYTMGTLAAFFFSLQFVTGFLMVMYYVPQEDMAYQSVEQIQHDVPLGWLIRQLHVWGSNFIVVVLLLHMIKILWYGSYKRPREFTWFVGFLLFIVTLGFCLSGYLLPWNELAYWGTRVAVATIDALPYIGPTLKGWVCGGVEVSGSTIGRFFALHVIVLPALLVGLLGIHLALVTKHGIAPKTTIREEKELGYYRALEKHGAEPFFPRQIYRELFVLNLGFALLVSVAYFWPLALGEPQSSQTPEHIKPEWYFLPVYQFLKYFDDSLYAALPFLETWEDYQITPEFLGFCVIHLILLAVFLLPLLDRGRHRALRRRPFFALCAFVLAMSIVVLGGLGYLSGRTVTVGGTTYRFTSKGYPEVVVAEAPFDGTETVSRAPADPRPAATDAEVDGGLGEEKVAAGPGEAPPDREESPSGVEETVAADTADAADGSEPQEAEAAEGDGETDGEIDPGDVITFRTDGLAPGGTCSDADCHESAPQNDWVTSVHFQNQVECRQCHGGLDTRLPRISREFRDDLEDVLEPEAFAHLGVHLTRRGKVTRPPLREINQLCGRCHLEVLEVFSELHYAAPPPGQNKMVCIRCHTNHAVQAASEALYEKGYTDESDPRTKPFQAARRAFAELAASIQRVDSEEVETLRKRDVPVKQFEEALAIAREDFEGKRHLVHALDESRLEAEIAGLRDYVGAIEGRVTERVRELDGRWRFVAFTWVGVILLNTLIGMRLLSLSRSRRHRDEASARGATAPVRVSTEIVPARVSAAVATSLAPTGSSLAEALDIASLPDELFEVDEEEDREVEQAQVEPEAVEPEAVEQEVAAPAAVPLVDRLRISSLPDEVFEVEEEPPRLQTTIEDAERRALLDPLEDDQ